MKKQNINIVTVFGVLNMLGAWISPIFFGQFLKIYMQQKRTKVIRIVLGTLIPIVCTVIYIPPEVTITQIISAGFIFIVIVYFAIKALKHYKII